MSQQPGDNSHPSVTAVILAGGRGSRMNNQDKGLVILAGQPMISYIINALAKQADHLVINANRNLESYADFNLPVISDADIEGFHGPLAGMLSAMQNSEDELLLCVPCDSPFVPDDLLSRMLARLQTEDAEIAVAHDGQRLQPVFALLKCSLADSLQAYLAGGDRKIDLWYQQHKMVEVDMSDIADTFININTPEEHQRVEQKLGRKQA